MSQEIIGLTLSGLKVAAILLAGIFGMLALLVDYKGRDGRITAWGKIALLGTVLSTVVAAGSHVLEERRSEESARRDREETVQLLREIRRGIHRFDDLTLLVTIHARPSSQLLSEGVILNHVRVRNPAAALHLGLVAIDEWEDVFHQGLKGALRLLTFKLAFRDPTIDEELLAASTTIELPIAFNYAASDEAVRERHVDVQVRCTDVSREKQLGTMTSLEDLSGKIIDFVVTFGDLPDAGFRGGDIAALEVVMYFDRRPIRLPMYITTDRNDNHQAVGFEYQIPAEATEGNFGIR